MTPAISDGAVVTVLRPFVRATRPVLDALRDADPFGLRARALAAPAVTLGSGPDGERGLRDKVLDALAGVHVPGTAAWAAMDPAQRSRWWARRVGRLTTLVAAVPGVGGVLANRLPVSKTIGAAGQGLVAVAIAGEYGVRHEDALVALLGAVLFRRELAVTAPDAAADAAADARAAELTGDLGVEERPALRRVASAVWRLGRALWAFEGELDKRPHGNWFHEGLGMLPVVGAVGKFLGEWSGLNRVAAETEQRVRSRG